MTSPRKPIANAALPAPQVGTLEAAVPHRRPGGLPSDRPLFQQVWMLAKWPLIEQFMAFAVTFVDTALAARLSKEAADAIGAAGFVVWLMGLMQGSVGVGATALIARAVGGRHRREANAALGQAVVAAALVGVAVAVIFWGLAPEICYEFGLRGEAQDLAAKYLRILAISAPFMSLLFVGASCLRGAGDFRTPVWLMVFVNVINSGCTVAAVYAPAPLGGWGLPGIGFGTTLAWTFGGIAMIVILLRGRGGMTLHLHRLRPQPIMLKRLARVSLPTLTESGLYWIAHASVIWTIGHMDYVPDAIGAHGIAIRLEGLSYLPGFAFSQAAATMVGQYLGARNVAMAKKSAWMCLLMGGGFMTTLGVGFIFFGHGFTRLMTDNAEFLHQVPKLLFVTGFAQCGFAAAMILGGAIRGAGDTRWSMAMSIISMYAIRVPGAYLVGYFWGMGLQAVWIVLAADLMLRGAMFTARFLHGGWARVRV